MKRRTDTLDAEYKRLGLMRPNQAKKAMRAAMDGGPPFDIDATVQFEWKGTRVWGVKLA